MDEGLLVQPSGIGAVVNTAYSFVGRGDMTCSEMVKQAFLQNGYAVPNGLSYNIGYSIGTNTSVVQVGDLIFTSDHVVLVVGRDGANITVIEGGMNGTYVVQSAHVITGNLIIYDGIGGGTPITDIRRV